MPQNLTGTVLSATKIQLQWDPVPNAEKYILMRGPAPGTETTFSSFSATSTTYVNGRIQPGETTCWQVQSVVGGHRSLSSNEVCLTTPAAPGAPTDVTAMATSSSRIQLTWSAVPDATFYRIYQSSAATGPFSLIATIQPEPSPTFIVTGLQASTTYYFRVSTVFSGGESGQSDPAASATTFTLGQQAFWNFDEESGTTAMDSSGFGYNGTLASATYTNDKAPIDFNRSAISFTGATASAVNVPHAPVFNFAGDFSLTLWAKASAAGTVRLAGKRASGCGATTWELGQDAAGLYFAAGTATHGFGQALPVGAWTHVAVTRTGTTVDMFVNGQAVATVSNYETGAQVLDPLQLGNSGGCGGTAAIVDDVRVYNIALTPTEVSTIGDRPEPPANLTATALAPSRVRLEWDAVAGATKYLIYRGTGPGTAVFFTSTDANDSIYEYGHLMPGQTTSWRVGAIVNGLVSDLSIEAVVTTPPAPDAPADLVATAVSSTRINLSWTAAANAGKYYVYQSVSGGPFAYRGTTNASATPTFAAIGLTAGTMYTYVVRTVDVRDNKTESADSAPASATTLP